MRLMLRITDLQHWDLIPSFKKSVTKEVGLALSWEECIAFVTQVINSYLREV